MRHLFRPAAIARLIITSLAAALLAPVLVAAPASAVGAAFTCDASLYQVATTMPGFFKFNAATNTFASATGANWGTTLNALAYNTADNYLYAFSGTTMYKIDAGGVETDWGAVASPMIANPGGGDYWAGHGIIVAPTSGLSWALVTVGASAGTSSAVAYSPTGSWGAYDITIQGNVGYGLNNQTLYTVDLTTSTITTKTVGSAAGAGYTAPSSGAYGAAYSDNAGNVYFYNNTDHKMFEIKASQLGLASPSSNLVGGAATTPALTAPNDGASCPLAQSAYAPTVVSTDTATSVTDTSATLNGVVNANNDTTTVEFCFSTSNTVDPVTGRLTPSETRTATPSPLTGASNTSVSANVTGLSVGTKYYFQVCATNSAGAAYGGVRDFTTTGANPPASTYTVTYHGTNSDTGTVPSDGSSPYASGDTVTVLGNPGSLGRSRYRFMGWNTASDMTGTFYYVGNTFTILADTSLYPYWLWEGTVHYYGNGNTGGTAPADTHTYVYGESVTLLGPGRLTRTGYTFTGWNTAANGSGISGTPSGTFSMPGADRTYYAQWTPNEIIVTYSPGTGSGTLSGGDTVTAHYGDTYTLRVSTGYSKLGHHFTGWVWSENEYASGDTMTLTLAPTFTAQWAPDQLVITYLPGTGSGTLSGGDTVTVNYGEVHTVKSSTGYSKTGYHFTGWLSSSVPFSAGDTATITAAKLFTAQWAPNAFTLTTNASGSGTVTPGGTVSAGETRTLTATPAPGWHFLGWTGDCAGSSNPLVVTITSNMTCTANFGANPIVTYKLTVTTVGDGTATPGTQWYNDGTKATVKAVPAAGWFFTGWSGACTGTAPTCDVMMTMDKAVTATFVKGVTINTNTAGGGSVNSSQPTGTPLLPGTKVTLTATPNDGWEFTGWSGSCSGTENPLTVTLDDSKECTANFKEKPKPADPIEVKDDTYKTGPNQPLKLPAGASIMKNDGTSITKVALATKTKHGTISLAPNGKLIYKPNKGFVGVDTFKYKAFDANGRSVIATVKIVVAPPKPKDIKTGR